MFYRFYRIFYNKSLVKDVTNEKDITYTEEKKKTFVGEVWFFLYNNSLLISPIFFNSIILDKRRVFVRATPLLLIPFVIDDYEII